MTSGLVELSVYGIVSLYEKYEAPKPADGAAATTTTPTNAPEPAAPAPNTPAPAPNTTTPPKMRRRYARV